MLGSVYQALLDSKEMEDPFWRDNELEALEWMKKAMSSRPEEAFSATIYDHAGDIYHALGDVKNAVRCWKEAVTNYSPEPVDITKILRKIKDAGGKW